MTKNKLNQMVLFLVIMLLGNCIQAQELNNITGGNVSGTNGSLAYSVGLSSYTTNFGDNGTVIQGVQNAYEIFTLVVEETELELSISVYPNPSKDNLTIELKDYTDKSLSYYLIGIHGKTLRKGTVIKRTVLDIVGLPPSIYFMKIVNQENEIVKSFKIIKN